MRTPPDGLPDDTVLARVREVWRLDLARVEHLPWGFGSWHWAAYDAGGARRWFVTADALDHPGRLAELEGAYATARELGGQLPVVAVEPTPDGGTCCVTGEFALSVTPWVDGARASHARLDEAGAAATATFLDRLHRVPPPEATPAWDPAYRSHRVLDDLPALVAHPWHSGPYADEARVLVTAHLDDVRRWRQRYAECVDHALAGRDSWVVTHGEPGPHNQLRTPAGPRWVDWESVRIAPRERDLADLVWQPSREWRQAYSHPVDRVHLELFDLAWRLDEVGQYTDWFRRPHTGTEDDRIAIAGLREELTRSTWPTL